MIKMLDVVAHPKFVCFVMEFASKGDLRGHLRSQGRLSEDRAALPERNSQLQWITNAPSGYLKDTKPN